MKKGDIVKIGDVDWTGHPEWSGKLAKIIDSMGPAAFSLRLLKDHPKNSFVIVWTEDLEKFVE